MILLFRLFLALYKYIAKTSISFIGPTAFFLLSFQWLTAQEKQYQFTHIDDYIAKPIKLNDLIQLLEKHF